MGLKHWILPNNQFKTHLFFQFLGGGDPFRLGSRSEGWIKLQTSLEKPSDKCQRTHIIQNFLHGILLFISVKLGLIANTKIYFQHPTNNTNFSTWEKGTRSLKFGTGRLKKNVAFCICLISQEPRNGFLNRFSSSKNWDPYVNFEYRTISVRYLGAEIFAKKTVPE